MDKWRDFPLPDGSYSDDARPWSSQDIVCYLPVKAEQAGTMSATKLRTAPGLRRYAYVGTRPIRQGGLHDVEDRLYVVSGTSLFRIFPDGTSENLGPIPGTGPVRMTHNQVAGGNQLFIATGTSAYVYADEGAELASGNPGGSPGGDTGGGSTGGGTGTTQGGGETSPTVGPNGGYPDDDEYPIPRPTVLDVDVIDGADFSDWKTRENTALSASWSDNAGALHFEGAGKETAYGYAWRYSLPYMPLKRYDITVEATVSADAGMDVRVGIAWGTSNAGELPNYIEASEPAEYTSPTSVSHTWRYEVTGTGGGPGVPGKYNIVNFMPIVQFIPDGAVMEGDADDVTMTIEEVPSDATVETLDHLDFDSGFTGWYRTPDPADTNPYKPTMSVTDGEALMAVTSEYFKFRWLICESPITTADAIGKYVGITGEVWCNDPTLVTSTTGTYPSGGVTFGLAVKVPGGDYVPVAGGFAERGDWTEREVWARVTADETNAPGVTYHAAVLMQAAVGKTCKVRNLSVQVTDEVID